MVDPITAYIMDAIEELKQKDKTREVSLAITKLEEALHWWQHAQRIAVQS